MDTQNPDLPPLVWNDCWEGEIYLASWAGFQSRRGPYAALDSDAPSDGRFLLRFDTDGAGKVPPTPAQMLAYRWLLDHEAQVASAVLAAVFAEYPRFREEFLDCYEEGDADAEATVPPLASADLLRAMMGLRSVCILPLCREDVGYVGFEFGCAWEAEHGLGVLTHKTRVVEVGTAEVSFDGNRAEEDTYDE